eukprot:gene2279-2623_t
MLKKEWSASDVLAKIKDVFHEKIADCEISILESSHVDVEDLVGENPTVFGTEEAGKSQAGDVKGILESLASNMMKVAFRSSTSAAIICGKVPREDLIGRHFHQQRKLPKKLINLCWRDASKSLTSLAHHIAENDYFLAGRVIAMSLVHGAAAPKIFSPVLYEALFKDNRHIHVCVDTVPDRDVKEVLKKLLNTADVDAANKVIDENDTLFSLAGTSCFVANESEIKKMAEEVAHCSEKGSSRQILEERVLSYWLDLLEDIQEKESELSFSDVLFFTTGCNDIPPLGFYPKPYLKFLHQPENDGNQSKLPKANTCANIIMLPVVHKSYAIFKEQVELGIKGSQGFGYA